MELYQTQNKTRNGNKNNEIRKYLTRMMKLYCILNRLVVFYFNYNYPHITWEEISPPHPRRAIPVYFFICRVLDEPFTIRYQSNITINFHCFPTIPNGSPAAVSVLFLSAPFSTGPDRDGFSDVFDDFEDFSYAVRFPGWPSGPAAGPSRKTAADLHFAKGFQRFPVVPQLPSVFFF